MNLEDQELETGNNGIGNIFTLATFNNPMPALDQRQAKAFGGGRESDESMGVARILCGMIIVKKLRATILLRQELFHHPTSKSGYCKATSNTVNSFSPDI